jgi:tight adherence protein B
MRRAAQTTALAAALATAAALLAVIGPPFASADSGNVRLSETGTARFPSRSYLLSLPPGRSVRAAHVHVRENGTLVRNASVLPASAASSRGYGVVLVIDTSRSMKGRPIADAFSAARAFARRRQPSQQLGVVTFNGSATVALPLTTDVSRINRVLAKPPELGRNTHIFDAVDTAVRMLGSAQVKPASVVVLSDGSDTGSGTALAQLEARAERAGVRIFSVGLRSGAFDPRALGHLAAATGADYSQANNPGDLARIYDELGSRLANEYVVIYRSLAGPKHRVHVSVSVDGFPLPATTDYVTPALHLAAPPYRASNFWASGTALLLVSLTCGLLLVGTVYFAFSRPGRRNLRRRVSQFVTAASVDPYPASTEVVASQPIFADVGRAFEGMKWWPAFEEEVDVAQIDMPATQLAGITVAVTIFLLAVLSLASGSVLVASLALGVPYAVRRFVTFKVQRQRRRFADQLADNLQVIASALRAGHSLVSAMAVAVTDAPQPTKREFERVLADEKLGVPLDDGLSVVARRMENRDLEQLTLVATLQRDTGGNTAEVLDRVADTVRARADLRRLITTLTAQGRISGWIVTALPVVLALVISVKSPTYLQPLVATGIGHAMLIMALIFLVLGKAAINKIVDIKV